jgi:hypothetical protein
VAQPARAHLTRLRTDAGGFFAMRLTRRVDYCFTWQPPAGAPLRISAPWPVTLPCRTRRR